MKRIHRAWQKTPKFARQIAVFIAGWIIVLAGLVMLATPGPGWGAILLGFAILATEFAHARRTRDWLLARLRQIIRHAQKLWHKLLRRKS